MCENSKKKKFQNLCMKSCLLISYIYIFTFLKLEFLSEDFFFVEFLGMSFTSGRRLF